MSVIHKQRVLHSYMSLQCFVKVGNALWLVWSNQFLPSFINPRSEKKKHQTLKTTRKSCSVINPVIARSSLTVSSTKTWKIMVLSCMLLALHSRGKTDLLRKEKLGFCMIVFPIFLSLKHCQQNIPCALAASPCFSGNWNKTLSLSLYRSLGSPTSGAKGDCQPSPLFLDFPIRLLS